MSLTIGDKLGPYEILEGIGKGGMGEVWKARDTRLDRIVAIKTSKQQFSERFEREARAVAALNHPNICTLHDVGPNYLVMEFVEGAPLKGPLPLDEVLRLGHQITAALEAAHEKHITHRDLKPGNILLKPDGSIKVLDFGLAKIAAPARTDVPVDESPTLTMGMTEVGMILGTAAYMAPEQAKGKEVDKRADIWAFGVVLYELVTGSRPFHGTDMSEVLASVIKEQPSYEPVPYELRRLLKKCLEKDPAKRLRDIGDVWELLDAPPVEVAAALPPPAKRSLMPWGVAAALALSTGLALWSPWRVSPPVEQPLIRISGDLGSDAIAGSNLTVAISPDGKRIVYPVRSGGKQLLATRLLDQATPTLLSGTDGAVIPFFSPDGQWIGFGAEGKLKKISVLGGAALALCDAPSLRGASWGADGNIIVALSSNTNAGLSRVPDSGGQPQSLTKPADKGEQRQFWPHLLPDGNAVLFAGTASGNWDTANVKVLALKDGALKTGEIKILVPGGYSPHYLPPTSGEVGHLVYIHEGVILGVPFDPAKLELRGTPVPLVEGVAASPGQGGGQFDVSRTGSLVYLEGKTSVTGVTLSWMDSSGKMEPLLARPDRYYHPRFSPDGNLLAISKVNDKGYDVYVYDWRHDTMPRLTFTGATNYEAEWSPDGKHLVYDSVDGLWWVRADGGGEPQRLLEGTGVNRTMNGVSPDGKRVSYSIAGPDGKMDSYTLPLDLSDPEHPKAGKSEVFLRTPAHEVWARFSPDGRWMAYVSDESGTRELYVRPFPGPGGKWQISSGGVTGDPVWSRDGRQLFFGSPEFKIMVSDYTAKGDSFSYSKPRVWSDTALNGSPTGAADPYFDIAPDGKRFAVIPRPDSVEEKQGNLHATFLLNFADEVRRRVPVGK